MTLIVESTAPTRGRRATWTIPADVAAVFDKMAQAGEWQRVLIDLGGEEWPGSGEILYSRVRERYSTDDVSVTLRAAADGKRFNPKIHGNDAKVYLYILGPTAQNDSSKGDSQ